VCFVGLSLGTGATRVPFCDEAWLATPALNLATKGHMGTTNLETAGTWAFGMDRYTYWVMPLYLIAEAAWYKIVGFSLLKMRALSTLWGLLAIVAWCQIVNSIWGRRAAGLAAGFIACDYFFVSSSAAGRMDMMSAALGFAGWAAYLAFRERNLKVALLASHALMAGAVFSHPYGVFEGAGLAAMMAMLDRKRIGAGALALCAIPYIAIGGAWALYIAEAPELFRAQIAGNSAAGGRFSSLLSPFTALLDELRVRYLESFGFGAGTTGLARLQLLVLGLYLLGIIGSILLARRTRHPRLRLLLTLTAIQFACMTFLEGKKSSLYFVHMTPFFGALLAITIDAARTARVSLRWAAAGVACLYVVLQVGGLAYGIRRDPYRRYYEPLIAAVRANYPGSGWIMGNASVGFGLAFPAELIDDRLLGYHSGKRPALIVIDKDYRDYHAQYRRSLPPVGKHIDSVMQEFEKTFENE
jgi:4-amino-4-deoxy-L-arabinose transferase-like glycosyltransferase